MRYLKPLSKSACILHSFLVRIFLNKSTLFYLDFYETKNITNTLTSVSCTWFVHILTVYASIETSTSYPCGHVPRPIYYSSHTRVSVNYISNGRMLQYKCIDYTHCLSTEAACMWSFISLKSSGLFIIFLMWWWLRYASSSFFHMERSFSISRCSKITRAFFCLLSPLHHF